MNKALHAKKLTLDDVISYPLQALALAENDFLLDAVFKNKEITKRQALNLTDDQLEMVNLPMIKNIVNSKRGLIDVLEWPASSSEARVLKLSWVKNFLMQESLSADLTELIEKILSKASLLLAIDNQFLKKPFRTMASYLSGEWKEKLTVRDCITADPVVIYHLLFNFDGRDNMFLRMVTDRKLATVEELLKLNPEQIRAVVDERVRCELLKERLTIREICDLSAREIIESAEKSLRNLHKKEESCLVQ